MTPISIPPYEENEAVETELRRLMEPRFQSNRWRPDFEEWTKKRLWSERHQGRLVERLERYVLEGRSWEGLRVLDLGTGRGGLSVVLKLGGARVTAMDLRRRNCKMAITRGKRYGISFPALRAVGEHLPFAAATFDLVVCKDVTEHCIDPDRLLGEISRVLAPQGRAYVTFINRLSWNDPHYKLRGVNFLPRFLAEWVIRSRGREKSNSSDLQRLSDMHYYTIWGARRATRRAGLSYGDVTLERMSPSGVGRGQRCLHRCLSIGTGTFEAVLRKP